MSHGIQYATCSNSPLKGPYATKPQLTTLHYNDNSVSSLHDLMMMLDMLENKFTGGKLRAGLIVEHSH